ncbi:MAG: RsmD family RNA methyltransferase, partial [Candidatus Omnitrophota bacterium]
VFLDPPYEGNWTRRTLTALSESKAVAKGAWVVLECGKRESVPEGLGRLTAVKTKSYGDTKIIVFSVKV